MKSTAEITQRILGTDLKASFIILICLFLIYIPFIIARSASGESFLKGDCYYYRAMIISIIEDHDLLLENNLEGSDLLSGQLALTEEGYRPKHPIIMPFVSVPFYVLLGDQGLLLFNILDCALLIVIVSRLNRLFFDPVISVVTSLLYAVGTLLLEYVYNYSPDIFASVLILAALYFVLTDHLYVGALFLGISIFAKITNAPLVIIIFIYILLIQRDQNQKKSDVIENHTGPALVRLSKTLIIFMLSLMPFLFSNFFLYGSPWTTGYQHIVIRDPVSGQAVFENHAYEFNQPIVKGSLNLLFDPINGILPTNPILVLALAGILKLSKLSLRKELILLLTLASVQFLIFAKYDYWFTSHFSNRFLITSILLTSVFSSKYLESLFQTDNSI